MAVLFGTGIHTITVAFDFQPVEKEDFISRWVSGLVLAAEGRFEKQRQDSSQAIKTRRP